MEPAAAWGPSYEFQLADWTVEEPVTEVWAPAPYSGHPLEYASIDIFGACYVPESDGGQEQLVEHYYSAEPQPQEGKRTQISITREGASITVPAPRNTTDGETKVSNTDRADDIEKIKERMHRYPASLGDLDKSYTTPRIVAIGPYHYHKRNLPHRLKQAEEMKKLAAEHCVMQSGSRSREVLFEAVVSAADDMHARGLYDKDGMAGIKLHDFHDMMFRDACFLVQYMLMLITRSSGQKLDDCVLHSSFLGPNSADILHDVTLLENQLPWKVVEAVMAFLPEVSSRNFVASLRGWLQDQKIPKKNEKFPFVWDERYQPPHLLGLLRRYTVGISMDDGKPIPKPIKRSVSVSAMELGRIGIWLTPNKETTELIHMGLDKKWIVFNKLCLPPLSLNRNRASYLVNMAALEMCTVPSFSEAPDEDSAVCSYLLLLAMLAYRVEDVHELRRVHLLQGGGGLTNDEALLFFTSLQGLRLGKRYLHVMKQIESYKEHKQMLAGSFRFYNDNNKTIKTIAAGVASVGSIIGTLLSIKGKL